MRIPELLAPAGSIETFRAAFTAGADAFYLGYGDFNARKRAKNFTEEELRLTAEFAHAHGRKIYLTVNTLVFEHELPALLPLLELVREIRADAVIVQDLGVLSLLREQFPEIPVHASTQMFCHNSLHARFLREQGVSRLILPRELSLAEIGTMMERVPAEYEVFVHGAMCFSFSGCCLASSWLYGDSGNRGRCRQVCRHVFQEAGTRKTCYPFSMKDLNALEFTGELVRLGVSSLKIEGRLKNAEYVFEVVSAYRAALDAIRDGVKGTHHTISRQRETESGYFGGETDYRRLVQRNESGTAGEVIGEAVSVSGREIRVTLTGKPSRGMRLRVQDSRGRNLHEGALIDFSRDRNTLVWRTKAAVNDTGYTPPYTVYAVGRSAPSDALGFLRAQVKKTTIERIVVDADIVPGALRVRATFDGIPARFEYEYPLATETSRTHSLAPDECARILAEADRAPFAIGSVACRVAEGLFCPLGALKEARRSFYRDLTAFHTAQTREATTARRTALERRLAAIRERRLTDRAPGVFLRGDVPRPRRGEKPEFVTYPVELDRTPDAPPSPDTVLILPHFVSETAVGDWTQRIHDLVNEGYTRFIAPTYGWLGLRDELPGVEFIAGPYLYAVNPLAVDLLEHHGVRLFVLSPDIREEDAEPVSRFSGRLVCPNAPREMFITRLRVPSGQYTIKGRTFRPRYFPEYTVIGEE